MSAAQWKRPKLRARIVAGDPPAWLLIHPRRRYVTQAVLATPPWMERKALLAVTERTEMLSMRTGVNYVEDHIVPLSHPYVCGLNVPWNLQVIPRGSNAAKSNAWCEWHGDLFTEPEQFTLL